MVPAFQFRQRCLCRLRKSSRAYRSTRHKSELTLEGGNRAKKSMDTRRLERGYSQWSIERYHGGGCRTDAVQGALGILIGSLRPGPWTRGGENDIATFAEQSLVIKIEDKVPEFTETELEEEQLEIYCDKDGDDEIEYIFAVDEDKEIRDLDT
ncbi:hypothetical protein BDN71DRAFT_1447987 [Pleurotus eryngii]|uniref:Uncharacterized protein n=1 Tax=Pleurotus eryngii TaxID=5323 RepID=A0A9P5ZV98_PLEER|nr:hypothetical protein BDN71DRAFT_1447987 [Pleurotus eryngii]